MIIRIFPGAIPLSFMDSAPLGLVPRSSLFCGFSEAKSVQMQGAQGQT